MHLILLLPRSTVFSAMILGSFLLLVSPQSCKTILFFPQIQVVILNIHQRLENIEKTFAEEDENLNAEEIKRI